MHIMDEDDMVIRYCSNYHNLDSDEQRHIREKVYRRQLHDSHSFCPYNENLKSRKKVGEVLNGYKKRKK